MPAANFRTNPSPSKAASTETGPLPRRIAAHLAAGSAVFFWRQGRWFMRADGRARSNGMGPLASAALDTLSAAGRLFEGPPGFYRGCPSSPRPLLNDLESPLARLAARRNADGSPSLDPDLLSAGERMRRDFERAGLGQHLTTNYRPEPSGGKGHTKNSDNAVARLSDEAISARQDIHRAMDAVGPELSGILYRVCCLAEGLEAAERCLALPRRAGRAVLEMALARLARHYGFKKPLHHGGPSRIGHWALEGTRAGIMPQRGHQP